MMKKRLLEKINRPGKCEVCREKSITPHSRYCEKHFEELLKKKVRES
jgi:hypothetical protein